MEQYTTKYASLKNRLALYEKMLGQDDKGIYLPDLVLFSLEVLSYLKSRIGVGSLENKISAYASVDIPALKEAYALFASVDMKVVVNDYSGTPINFQESYDTLGALIESLEKNAGKFPAIEIALRLEMLGDSCFSMLLMNPSNPPALYNAIVETVEKKLRPLSQDEIIKVWSYIKLEITLEPKSGKITQDSGIISRDFFLADPKDVNEMVSRCARYIVQYRPKLILEMFKKSPCSTPMLVAGVSKIISIRSTQMVAPTFEDEAIFQGLARIAYLWDGLPLRTSQFGKHDIRMFARVLEVKENGRLLDGPEFDEAKEMYSNLNNGLAKGKHLILELHKILDLIQVVAFDEYHSIQALRRYKLGAELLCPSNIKHYDGKGELDLQKEICHYLLSQGFFSFGVKFGRSEIDLMTEEMESLIVIETKVYRRLPSDGAIKKHLVQLINYMDQNLQTSVGVLVIYNFSGTHISEPKKWFRGRFRILPINLNEKTPSSRYETIEFDENDREIISIRRIEKFIKTSERKDRTKKKTKNPEK